MKVAKSIWKRVGVIFIITLLFCISAAAVMAADAVEVTDTVIKLPTGVEDGDTKVRLYTYTIYDEEEKETGTVELRYGTQTGSVRLWITVDGTNGVPVEINNNNNRYFRAGSRHLEIVKETWQSYFKGDNYTCTVESKELPAIPAPSGISWDVKTDADGNPYKTGRISYGTVDEAYRYQVILYQNGKRIASSTTSSQGIHNYARAINESGTYTLSVCAIGDKYKGDSELVWTKEDFDYKAPSERVGKTTDVWWTAREGETIPTIINWQMVAGAGGYEVYLYTYDENGNRLSYVYGNTAYNTEITSHDWSREITNINTAEHGKVIYEVTVRALSGNINIVANSERESAVSSGKYEIRKIVEDVKTTLNNTTADTIRENVEKLGIDSVATAMQSDAVLLEQIASLEAEYANKNSIMVKKPEISHDGIVQDKIRVVGAGINGTKAVTGGEASAIGLNFSKPSIEQDINKKLYENAVQVSITLENGGQVVTRNLVCPITITMYPPTGVDLDRLVILHYHSDGTYESIYPAKNVDGTITFSVTRFSTFVFTNLVRYSNDTGNSGNNNNNNNNTNNPDNDNNDDDDNTSYSHRNSVSVVQAGVRTDVTGSHFVKEDGTYAKSEWVKKGNVWYYAGADTILLTGWYQNQDGVWYYLKDTCEMATGWQLVSENWYFLDLINGDMKTGWLLDADGKWYFLGRDGDMKKGWIQTADGKWYYLGADGACYMNTVTPDGFSVDANGAWIE